jgi:urea carboxylase-associated protein 1
VTGEASRGGGGLDVILRDDEVAPGRPWNARLPAGAHLRIVDLAGRQGVDFLCYNAEDPEERYNAPNTLKAATSLCLGRGTVLYSDRARALMTIVADTCGGHDTIGGCCSAWSNELLYGVKGVPGCRENFLEALGDHGLGWRDIVPNINFFCSVPVTEGGALAPSVFVAGRSRAGDYVELRAEMPVLAVISNCPQVNNPCNDGAPTPIRVVVHTPGATAFA